MTEMLQQQLEDLPTDPGIYKYFDANDELIYVGKAVNLKNRVRSYFSGPQSPKTQVLVKNITRLETIVVQSEVDALILEANLIKEFRPRYNIILKDDKTHLYLKITLYQNLPRLSTCRQTDMALDPKATYFGPYPSSGTVKQTLRYLRRVFPYLAHHQPPVTGRRRPPQSYFYYNLPLGPVDAEIDQKLYRQQVFQLVHFLEGKRQSVADELEKEMKAAAKDLAFERAAQIKQQLDGLNYVSQLKITPETYIANPELIADKRQAGLEQLAQILLPLVLGETERVLESDRQLNYFKRIECFDISNTAGQQAVGSMVVFEEGEAKKSDYRRFRIKREQAPNDFAMLQEVLVRRFRRLKEKSNSCKIDVDQDFEVVPTSQKPDASFTAIPDLIIVDGGKGQLSAAQQALKQLELNIPIVGMTKREEELVVIQQGTTGERQEAPTAAYSSEQSIDNLTIEDSSPLTHHPSPKPKRSSAHGAIARTLEEGLTQTTNEGSYAIVRLPRGSEALFLIQRIRDEAHRFAITYHRKLRGKAFLPKVS